MTWSRRGRSFASRRARASSGGEVGVGAAVDAGEEGRGVAVRPIGMGEGLRATGVAMASSLEGRTPGATGPAVGVCGRPPTGMQPMSRRANARITTSDRLTIALLYCLKGGQRNRKVEGVYGEDPPRTPLTWVLSYL